MIDSCQTNPLTSDELFYLGQRLPMFASIKYLENLEKELKLPPNKLLSQVDFSKHPDNLLKARVEARDRAAKQHEERIKKGIAKPAKPFVHGNDMTMIASPDQLSPIIPQSVRDSLSTSLQTSPSHSPRASTVQSLSVQKPSTPPLVHNLPELCTLQEHKTQE